MIIGETIDLHQKLDSSLFEQILQMAVLNLLAEKPSFRDKAL